MFATPAEYTVVGSLPRRVPSAEATASAPSTVPVSDGGSSTSARMARNCWCEARILVGSRAGAVTVWPASRAAWINCSPVPPKMVSCMVVVPIR